MPRDAAIAMRPAGVDVPTFDPRIAQRLRAAQSVRQPARSRRPRKAYAFGFLDENLDYEQQVLALNASGDLFEGFGAGPIQGAIGA